MCSRFNMTGRCRRSPATGRWRGLRMWGVSSSSDAEYLPDFQGGLVVRKFAGNGSIQKFDGITGQPYPAYSPSGSPSLLLDSSVVHTDGTIFVVQRNWLWDEFPIPT